MVIVGYSVSSFIGKKDGLKHNGLKIIFGSIKDDETHTGIYFVKDGFFTDPKVDFIKLVKKYYEEGTDLDLLYSGYGSIKEIRPIESK